LIKDVHLFVVINVALWYGFAFLSKLFHIW